MHRNFTNQAALVRGYGPWPFLTEPASQSGFPIEDTARSTTQGKKNATQGKKNATQETTPTRKQTRPEGKNIEENQAEKHANSRAT